MQFFGREAAGDMTLVAREPERLLFSDPYGDLVVAVEPGQLNLVSVITTHWHAEAQDFLQRLAEPSDGVLHYETESQWQPGEILQQARSFFGPGENGLGLTLALEAPQALQFTGGGGQVEIAVHPDGQPRVDVAAREWTYHAEQFTRQVSSEH
jgi:hypothetical protein